MIAVQGFDDHGDTLFFDVENRQIGILNSHSKIALEDFDYNKATWGTFNERTLVQFAHQIIKEYT